ncbi:MAG: FAD-dependent thymidylate synthase [Nanoarchaeota archaeon]
MVFLSSKPNIELIDIIENPSDLAVASARSCYSPELIKPKDVGIKKGETREHWDRLRIQLYNAEHHTPFGHAHLVFGISGVSRLLIWSLFHDQPFHNSNQDSQRFDRKYRKMTLDDFVIPDFRNNDLNLVYKETLEFQLLVDNGLFEMLKPTVEQKYYRLFPKDKGTEEGDREVNRKTQEITRYVLPIATKSHLYHTINTLTLQRYYYCAEMCDVSEEARIVVNEMINEAKKFDPNILMVKNSIKFEDTLEHRLIEKYKGDKIDFHRNRKFVEEFDESLKDHISKLIDHPNNPYRILGDSLRTEFGLTEQELSDEEAVYLLLNPAKDPYLLGPLNITMMSKITRALNNVYYTFKKKLSHSADSQDQRHRGVLGSRPFIMQHYFGEPDYIIPDLIKDDEKALSTYKATMKLIFNNINYLLENNANSQYVAYLLPNAYPIRFIESGSLLHLRKKFVERLCYNAQKEIWQATSDEVDQITKVHPLIGKWFGAPCDIAYKADSRRNCPEGYHFCGEKVWLLNNEERKRII